MYCQNIILFFKINFNWRKIALPCCVGFCHTTAQISHNHAHVTLPPSLVSKESARNAGDPGLIPVSGRSAGEGIGYPLQYSWAFLVAELVKNLPAVRETWVRSLSWEDP